MDEEMKRKKDDKKCGVCGDYALGSNFNAITCESCKAFFRRNALKTKEFKCPFDNNCKVDVITRRFCQKCRLKKCFDIGMKKEWILSEEEKKAKRLKIEKNRQKRNKQISSEQNPTQVKTEVLFEDNILSPLSSISPMTPQTPGNAGIILDLPQCQVITHRPLTPSDCEYSPASKVMNFENSNETSNIELLSSEPLLQENLNLNEKLDIINDVPEETLNKDNAFQVIDNSNHSLKEDISYEMQPFVNSSTNINSIPQSVYDKAIEIEFTDMPLRTSTGKDLTDLERLKLQELVIANEVLKMPLICPVNDPSLVDVLNMTDYAIRRLIKMSKRINSFKNLCQNDQIALLKGGCTELMILRSVMSYDPEKECWKGPEGPKIMSIKVDILKEAKGNVYEEHKRFITSFHPQWRTDENIMLLLSGIALFSPDRPNIIHKEVIKLEQNTYYFLLRRYLESIYSFCESQSIFLQLIQKIQELHILNENHVRVYLDVNPKEVEPLLIEIFDLKY